MADLKHVDVAIIGGLWRGLFVGRNVSRVAIVLVTRPCRFANELGAAVRCPRDATLMLNAIEFARLRCVTKDHQPERASVRFRSSMRHTTCLNPLLSFASSRLCVNSSSFTS